MLFALFCLNMSGGAGHTKKISKQLIGVLENAKIKGLEPVDVRKT